MLVRFYSYSYDWCRLKFLNCAVFITFPEKGKTCLSRTHIHDNKKASRWVNLKAIFKAQAWMPNKNYFRISFHNDSTGTVFFNTICTPAFTSLCKNMRVFATVPTILP